MPSWAEHETMFCKPGVNQLYTLLICEIEESIVHKWAKLCDQGRRWMNVGFLFRRVNQA